MKEEYYLTVLGALLHDVGKLGWRAEKNQGRFEHAYYSRKFVENLPTPILDDGTSLDMSKLAQIVQSHHKEPIEVNKEISGPLIIIETADHAAAEPVTKVVGEYKSWAGTIQLVATRYPALDLGWYDYKPGGLFTPLPTNVSFAALKIYMSKTLSIGGDNLGVGIWVADESGKVIARLTLSAADFYSAGRSATFIPYCNNGIFFQKALQNHR